MYFGSEYDGEFIKSSQKRDGDELIVMIINRRISQGLIPETGIAVILRNLYGIYEINGYNSRV